MTAIVERIEHGDHAMKFNGRRKQRVMTGLALACLLTAFCAIRKKPISGAPGGSLSFFQL